MIQTNTRTQPGTQPGIKLRVFRLLERLLLAIGVFGVTAFATSYAILATWQSWENFVFDREVAGQSAGVADYVSEKADLLVEMTESLLKIEKPKFAAVSPEPRQSVVARTPSLATNTRPGVATNSLVGRLTIRDYTSRLSSGKATAKIRWVSRWGTFPGRRCLARMETSVWRPIAISYFAAWVPCAKVTLSHFKRSTRRINTL